MKIMKQIFQNLADLKLSIGGAFLAALPLILVFVLVTLPGFKKKIDSSKKNAVRVAVESIFQTLQYYYNKEKTGELSRIQAQKMAAQQVKVLRYGTNEYFWIHDLQLNMVMHPMKPELEGKSVSSNKDPTGKLFFVEMNNIVSKNGEGFVDYMWPKQGANEPKPKTSFVKLFAPWGWVVGNGVYADDIAAEIGVMERENLFWLGLALIFAIIVSLVVGALQLFKVVIPVRNVIQSLKGETAHLMQNAEGLSASSHNLNTAGQSHATSVHETVAAMTQMEAMMARTADSANQSSSMAEDTRKLVSVSLESLQSWSKAMDVISGAQNSLKESINGSVTKIQGIASIINKISGKTKLINDIVFQTKLLSFNASVEAARAGDAGKGFLVVAEEVGKLARLSGEISHEISSIVTDSNKKVTDLADSIKDNLTEVIERVSHSVAEGLENSEKSLKVLEQVVAISTQSSEMATSISLANQEQSKGSTEAMSGLRMIEQMSQQMSTIVQQTDQISNQLLERAHELNGMTGTLNRIVSSDEQKAA